MLAWQVLYFGAWSKQVEVDRRPPPSGLPGRTFSKLVPHLSVTAWLYLSDPHQPSPAGLPYQPPTTPRHLLRTICLSTTSSFSIFFKDQAKHSLWTRRPASGTPGDIGMLSPFVPMPPHPSCCITSHQSFSCQMTPHKRICQSSKVAHPFAWQFEAFVCHPKIGTCQ